MNWIKIKTLSGEARLVNISFVYEIRARRDGVDLVYEGGGIVHYDASFDDVEYTIAKLNKSDNRSEQERWLNGEK